MKHDSLKLPTESNIVSDSIITTALVFAFFCVSRSILSSIRN